MKQCVEEKSISAISHINWQFIYAFLQKPVLFPFIYLFFVVAIFENLILNPRFGLDLKTHI
jgi:hypothetical protein